MQNIFLLLKFPPSLSNVIFSSKDYHIILSKYTIVKQTLKEKSNTTKRIAIILMISISWANCNHIIIFHIKVYVRFVFDLKNIFFCTEDIDYLCNLHKRGRRRVSVILKNWHDFKVQERLGSSTFVNFDIRWKLFRMRGEFWTNLNYLKMLS